MPSISSAAPMQPRRCPSTQNWWQSRAENGLLKRFTKTVLETASNEEITEHLGFEKG